EAENRYVRPKETAPHLDLYEVAAVKGIFRPLMLIAPGYGFRRAVKSCSPREAGASKAEGAPKSVTSSCKCFPIVAPCVCLSCSAPIQGEPFAWRAALAAPTYIRPGVTPVPRSLMRVARGRAPRGMGPFSTAAFFSHIEIRSHIRLGSQKLLLSVFGL